MKLTQILTASAVAVAFALPATAEVKIALDSPPDLEKSGTYVWAHTFSEYLNEHGMEAVEYERNSLGEEAERLDQVSQGLLEVSMSDAKSAGTLDGTIFGAMMPYFFDDLAQLDKALDEGGMLEKINEGTTPKGVRVLDLVMTGTPTGIFTTEVPIRTLDDITGVRMRALDEVQINTFEQWGAKGTIVSWSEVPNALQTGVAGGYINPAFVPLTYGHTAFIEYFTNARMSPSVRVAIASEDWYQGLSDEEREIVQQAVERAHYANRELVSDDSAVLKQLEEAGIEVIELAPEEREKFREASQPIYETTEMPEGALDAWNEAVGR
ncbi:TRAP-type C4-dicarboxylate transport system, substrate-binding protein [Roseivivax halotolerans]|uniref:TRAP-type C4-dicarboxylate transport system, substrate-binding protein n=1 Tax=Roseivivax halotolerans TaxID=93684 RepID=A0A1I6ALS5_9RHOB|nr:TRAP transporter substrate-binding protein [Roseivivax halotolerans]SFQ69497.1 TRAP-type C4-dicarboxylate transport system, substrate-binding protein [Roseivivax halotolerans]